MQSSSALDCSGQDLAISIRVNNAIVMPYQQYRNVATFIHDGMEGLGGSLSEVHNDMSPVQLHVYKP